MKSAQAALMALITQCITWVRAFFTEVRGYSPSAQLKEVYYVLAVAVMFGSGAAWLWQHANVHSSPSSAENSFSSTGRTQKADIDVSEFKVIGQTNHELEYLRHEMELTFVELFIDRNLRVRSPLTGKIREDLKPDFTLNGKISGNSDKVSIAVELTDSMGIVVGSTEIAGSPGELQAIDKSIPEALMVSMGRDVSNLTISTHAAPATKSVNAYAHFFQARREVGIKNFQAAEDHLRRAIEIDPQFAMSKWAIGEIKRLEGDNTAASYWYDEAKAIDKDHLKLSIEPMQESNPVPLLLLRSRARRTEELTSGASYALVVIEDFDIKLHIWTFDLVKFQLKVAYQSESTGQTIDQFLNKPDDVFAINGGYFDRDSSQRLSPSGLLISDGVLLRDLTDKEPLSGVLYATKRSVMIVHRDQFRRTPAINAIQSGPLLVETAGKNGIVRNRFTRQRRSAICLDERQATFVLVDGGLDLFELGQFLATAREDGGLGCAVALNLDGGPSSQFVFNDGARHVFVPGEWKIQNALIMVRR